MEEIKWNNLTQNNKNSSGYGTISTFVMVLGIVVLLITAKIVDYLANTPEEQIQRKFPGFERVSPYDPRDNSFQVKKLRGPPNKMWFEVTVESSDSKERRKEYNYVVKAEVSKRFIFNPKLEMYSVVIE